MKCLEEIKFLDNYLFIVKRTKLSDCSQVDPLYMYLLAVFVRGIACILVFIVLVESYIFMVCVAILKRLPYIIFFVSLSYALSTVFRGMVKAREGSFVAVYLFVLRCTNYQSLLYGWACTKLPKLFRAS